MLCSLHNRPEPFSFREAGRERPQAATDTRDSEIEHLSRHPAQLRHELIQLTHCGPERSTTKIEKSDQEESIRRRTLDSWQLDSSSSPSSPPPSPPPSFCPPRRNRRRPLHRRCCPERRGRATEPHPGPGSAEPRWPLGAAFVVGPNEWCSTVASTIATVCCSCRH